MEGGLGLILKQSFNICKDRSYIPDQFYNRMHRLIFMLISQTLQNVILSLSGLNTTFDLQRPLFCPSLPSTVRALKMLITMDTHMISHAIHSSVPTSKENECINNAFDAWLMIGGQKGACTGPWSVANQHLTTIDPFRK